MTTQTQVLASTEGNESLGLGLSPFVREGLLSNEAVGIEDFGVWAPGLEIGLQDSGWGLDEQVFVVENYVT